jgi:hypothetical protein
LSDPGTPDGNEEHVSWTTFQDAWSASQCQMIVTDDAPGGADHSTAANAVSELSGGSTPAPPVPVTVHPAISTPTVPTIPAMPKLTDPGSGLPHIPGPILLPITFGAAAAAVAVLRPGRKNRPVRRATTVPALA